MNDSQLIERIAKFVDPEAWKVPYRQENTFVVRRQRSVQKAHRILSFMRSQEVK